MMNDNGESRWMDYSYLSLFPSFSILYNKLKMDVESNASSKLIDCMTIRAFRC